MNQWNVAAEQGSPTTPDRLPVAVGSPAWLPAWLPGVAGGVTRPCVPDGPTAPLEAGVLPGPLSRDGCCRTAASSRKDGKDGKHS